jgi:hypothetical protein
MQYDLFHPRSSDDGHAPIGKGTRVLELRVRAAAYAGIAAR